MSALVRTSHRVYKRYQSLFEAAITSLCLALLVGLILLNLPVYPPNWAPVIVALIALVGFRWPLAAYLLAVGVLLYPIYTLSLYLAILFLAVAIVVHRPASHYLGATVLVLSTPCWPSFICTGLCLFWPGCGGDQSTASGSVGRRLCGAR